MIGNTRRFIAGSLVLFLIAFLHLTGIAGAFGQRSKTKSHATDVAELFRNKCARCHGADGRGDTPLGQTYNVPDLTDADWWRKHSDIANARSLTAVVTHGKAGMPAFGKQLRPSDITSLVKYVRKFRQP
jgi:mono/diheme cytochrome c family protein